MVADHEWGYPVAEIAVFRRELAFAVCVEAAAGAGVSGGVGKDVEIREMKRELARVTGERGILRKDTAYLARDAK